MIQQRFPVYIPSKGRAGHPLTIAMFLKDGVDFRVVIEPSQVEAYAAFKDRLLVLPENDRGLVYARNWIKDHATAEGHARHWQFDDDISAMLRLHRGKRIYCSSKIAIVALETFVERYENVVLASFNSEFFVPTSGIFSAKIPPFFRNFRCYTCFLMSNALPNRWRRRYNEDTDMTLQVLADGHCTVLFNAFLIRTEATMTSKGGQTSIYVNDGRLKMARELERLWPGVVTVKRAFNRAQHHVAGTWRKFDTPFKRRADIDFAALPKVDDMGMKLKVLREIESPELRAWAEEEMKAK